MSILWSSICLAGLWGFLLSTLGLILNGFPARGVFDAQRSLKWGVSLLLSFIVWIIGMANA
ncbi:MAG: hypothetical protein A2075_16860 [Geobacteraceae bacterium GWC2_58_44]|nr:MAG: hypothetical protein A2075_16860 [Geobacteraceae bacterium GWC2_58_44]